LICAAIAALGFGFALGLQGEIPGISVFGTTDPGNSDVTGSVGSSTPARAGFQLASLESEAVSLPENETEETPSHVTGSSRISGAFNQLLFDPRLPSFAEPSDSFSDRFAAAAAPGRIRLATAEDPPSTILALADPGDRATDRPLGLGHSSEPGPAPATSSPRGSASKRRSHTAEATPDSASTPEIDSHTAIYDIAGRTVYLPDGRRLEAHSGLGGYLDDPRYVNAKSQGPTPPNVYALSLRESLFHGVRALRLTPVGGGNMYGRDGILAHTYMLGSNGQSNGCVSFKDYSAFLNAYLSGQVERIVVVERLGTEPPPQTASGGLAEKIKALFVRS
jgi:hypothetical protein